MFPAVSEVTRPVQAAVVAEGKFRQLRSHKFRGTQNLLNLTEGERVPPD